MFLIVAYEYFEQLLRLENKGNDHLMYTNKSCLVGLYISCINDVCY